MEHVPHLMTIVVGFHILTSVLLLCHVERDDTRIQKKQSFREIIDWNEWYIRLDKVGQVISKKRKELKSFHVITNHKRGVSIPNVGFITLSIEESRLIKYLRFYIISYHNVLFIEIIENTLYFGIDRCVSLLSFSAPF